MEIVLGTLCLILLGIAIYLFRDARERKYYQRLFELGDEEYKNLLVKMGQKDLLLDRGAAAIEQLNRALAEEREEKTTLQQSLEYQERAFAKLNNQKKSSEVRTGRIAEQMAPFLERYPCEPKTGRFIGEPIDFVHFDEDEIRFVEVKSGKSQLNKRQRQIRDLIKEGKVSFQIYRIKGDGDE